MKQKIAQLAGGAAAATLLFTGAGSAFAQSYGSTGAAGTVTAPNTTHTTGTMSSAGSMTSGSSSTSGTNGSSTPGIPNTGAGGDTAANIALLTASGIVVLGGAAYLLRRRNAFE